MTSTNVSTEQLKKIRMSKCHIIPLMLKSLILTLTLAGPAFCAVAQQPSQTNSQKPPKTQTEKPRDPFGQSGTPPHFTWGVDLGSGVDLTTHDMTMFELSAGLGYKNPWVRFAGVGASILTMMNNSSRCYPVYAMLRTSFSPYFQRCFLEVKAGVSFSSILDYGTQNNLFGSLGLGITLAHSSKFSSHVVLRGVAIPLKKVIVDNESRLGYTIAYASIGIGCAF